MAAPNRLPVRFSLLTAIIWLLVAAGIIFLLWQVIMRISESNLPVSTPTPNLTQVYNTIAAMLTAQQTTQMPASDQTNTPSPTLESTQVPPKPLSSPNKTSPPGEGVYTNTPPAPCDLAGAGKPIDITIPDDSEISPGQSFIKTWRLVNIGTCTWTTSYSARFFYGDRMDGPESVALKEAVPPAQSVEISVEMVAPLAHGTYQGNWKLSNPEGALFGIGPNGESPFWVRIIVPENSASTATATPGLTPTVNTTPFPSPTATTTPPVQASGELKLIPGDFIDLDTLTLNGDDEDLEYHVDASNYHWLAPQEQALIGVYGSLEPNRVNCQSANKSPAPIAVESLSIGTYLCYATHEGRLGRAAFVALEANTYTLTLDLLTWGLP
jgi:hypothetical protein